MDAAISYETIGDATDNSIELGHCQFLQIIFRPFRYKISPVTVSAPVFNHRPPSHDFPARDRNAFRQIAGRHIHSSHDNRRLSLREQRNNLGTQQFHNLRGHSCVERHHLPG